MPQVLLNLQQKFLDFWQNLNKSQKVRLYVISGLLFVAITAAIIFVSKPTYVPLVTNADPKDVKDMMKILDEKKITYKLTDDRSSILVNQKDNDSAQIALVDFPKMGMTFDDAFKYIKINTTESDKKKLWDQYKTSTLISKLKMFDNVEDADVELALPEDSVFIDGNEDKPTAYVRIKPKAPLSPEQVQGIVLMVSRAVVGLDPKDVTVVDNNLNVLNSETGDELVDRTNTQYDMKRKIKKELEQNVYEIFNGQFDNFDTIRVKVNPVLDFNKVKSETRDVANPTGMTEGALISSDITKEKLINGGANGAPGVGTNPGTGTTGQPSYPINNGTNSSYDKSNEKKNYKYKEALTQEEKALGELVPDKSSMTLVLWYGNRVTDESKLTDDFINKIKNDASNATGIPASKISVNKYKIVPPTVDKKPTAEVVKDLINTYGFFALMLLLIIGLMIAAIPRKKKAAEPELAPQAAQLATAGGPRFIVPDEVEEELPEIDMEERSEVKKQIEKFVKQKPDAVAQLLRNWLSDEWD
ncbi:MAG: flagellar basal-body MS-ring/collar protein FliF [Clostridia bacterium]|nr:flagellar basal-body MS-ring/collar protein FliF [Clostridia bacterium]